MNCRVSTSCGGESPGCCSRPTDPSRVQHWLHRNKENRIMKECSRFQTTLLGLMLSGVAPQNCWADSVTTVVQEGGYVPSPMDPGWQVYVGAVIGVIPFIIATYEFGKRVIIQRRCNVCGGSGLVLKGKYYKKCVACGGFLPWLGWRMFFFSSPGNGSPVMPPMNQKNKLFYSVPPARSKEEVEEEVEEKEQ